MRNYLNHPRRRLALAILEWGVFALSVVSLGSLVARWGFDLAEDAGLLRELDHTVLLLFLGQLACRLALAIERESYFKRHLLEYSLGVLMAVVMGAGYWLVSVDATLVAKASRLTQYYLVCGQFFIGVFSLLSMARASRAVVGWNVQPARLAAGSFFVAVLVGGGLLSLPRAHTGALSVTDAFFLSTSAVCVTGLSPVDVSQSLSGAGQLVLLLLIQAGGLGIMTLAGGVGLLFGGWGGMRQRMLLKDMLDSDGSTKVRAFLRRIVQVTFLLEACGAVYLWFAWAPLQPDPLLRCWWAVFHSISAFCNAGFSILPHGGLMAPGFSTAMPGLLGLSGLVLLGSLGCPVLVELGGRLRQGRRMSLAGKVLLRTHLALFAAGAAVLFLLGWEAGQWSISSGEGWLNGIVLSAMSRTAGFQHMSLVSLGLPSLVLLIVLMVVGGSPGSTAGGVKLTVLVTVAAVLRNLARGGTVVTFGKRELSNETCVRALAQLLLYCSFCLVAFLALVLYEKISALPALFEVVSALSTVGFSLDLTPRLSEGAKWLLIVCMFVGRLGIVTVLWAFFSKTRRDEPGYPRENLPIF